MKNMVQKYSTLYIEKGLGMNQKSAIWVGKEKGDYLQS